MAGKSNSKKQLSNKKRFMNGFEILLYGRSRYKVFQDIIYIFADTLQNAVLAPLKDDNMYKKLYDMHEQEYLQIIKQYNEKEQKIIAQMFALLVKELDEKPGQDFLGTLFMELNIADSKTKGQVFTPYSVSGLMAELTTDKKAIAKQIKEKGVVVFNDPAIGGGSTIIAAIDTVKSYFNRLNWQNHIFIVGQDIDRLSANMAFIQLSLLGCAAIIKIGDTLTDPVRIYNYMPAYDEQLEKFWFTPYWFSNVWQYRIFFNSLPPGQRKHQKAPEN